MGIATITIHLALVFDIDNFPNFLGTARVRVFPVDMDDPLVKSISNAPTDFEMTGSIHCIYQLSSIHVQFSLKHFSYAPNSEFFVQIALN